MKDSLDPKTEAASTPRAFTFLQAAIPFTGTFLFGAVVTGVTALFVYANVSDAHTRDLQFSIACVLGLGASIAAGWVAARRTLEADAANSNGSAIGLLRKYRRASARTGIDDQAGQYSIGESYLRELLGRRGA